MQQWAYFKSKPFFVMGILNVTPDSFYDGGRYNTVNLAFDRTKQMIDDGADIIDIGGESSRPGAESVSVDLELERVIPVIEKIRSFCDIPISIDTVKSEVAEVAIAAGALMINDISAGNNDSKMVEVALKSNCFVTLMHSREKPKYMQESPFYNDVVSEVYDEIMASVNLFISAGVEKSRIIIDPGIGFAKRLEDNLTLLANTKKFVKAGYEVLIGTSRKSFIGQITKNDDSQKRLAGSLASISHSFLQGARIFRVHDVKESVDYLKVLSEIEVAVEG